ncbi:MAG TPA: hypothetical protein VK939_11655 [Longimicrobiales bacterium]|nr:hypothetical protein [Longimicrobiales bacterium]
MPRGPGSRAGALLLATSLLLAGCAPRAEPPSASTPPTSPPSLAGRTVMVLPVQPAPGAGTAAGAEPVPGFDAELARQLIELAPRVRWVPATAVERAAQRSPTLRIRPRELAVTDFHRMKVLRVGEPLFSNLHSLGLLLDARYALLPWSIAYVPGAVGASGRFEVGVALIDSADGDVLWIGVVAGSDGPESESATVASAARALAERVAR